MLSLWARCDRGLFIDLDLHPEPLVLPSMPSKISIQCLFMDKAHRSEFRPLIFLFDETDFATMRVSWFLAQAQIQHRNSCKEGFCTLCLGEIIVKSAWLAKLPIREAYESTRDVVELKPDRSKGIDFMMSHDYLRYHVKSTSTEDVVTVLLESAFDGEAWFIPILRHATYKGCY